MAINKVVYGDTPLIDLTEDTVSPENLMAGETAHDRSGEEIEGTLITNEVKEVTYEEWSEMTPEEQADGSVYFIKNYPVLGGVYFFQSEEAMRAAEAILPDNAICITWEDTPYVVTADVVEYDNTDSGLDATDVNGAIDEVVEALDGKQDKLTNPLTQSDVVNNLTSTATNVPLSAAQGKVLNDELESKSIKITEVTITTNADGWAANYISLQYTPIVMIPHSRFSWFITISNNEVGVWTCILRDFDCNRLANTTVSCTLVYY